MRTALLLALLLLAPAQPALAEAACEPGQVPGLGRACLRPDGLYEVFLPDGARLTTHGPDPVPPPGDVGFGMGDEQRDPVCATDRYLHVLYGHPQGAPDRSRLADQLRDAVRRMNAVLNADALESGKVTADFKVLCDEAGAIQVDTFTGPAPGDSGFDAVVAAARSAGFQRPGTDYLVFYDDESAGVCGVGTIHHDDSLSAHNANLAGPDYGVAYESCWFGRTPMHENGHNQGAVQDLAPDWDLTGHCLEGIDVMCYPTSSILVLCGDRTHYDCDHDTYFDAEPEPGEWLATHWNIGSRLNPYIAFDHKPPPPAEPARPAEAPRPAPANETKPQAPAPANQTAAPAAPANATTPTRTAADRSTAPPAGPSLPAAAQRAPGPALAAALAALAALLALRRRRPAS